MLEDVVRLQRHLAPPTGEIHREVWDSEPARPPSELFDDLDPFGQGRPKVLAPLGHVHLMQVVGPHPHREARVVELADDPSVGVESAHQHRLVLDWNAVIHEELARPPGL